METKKRIEELMDYSMNHLSKLESYKNFSDFYRLCALAGALEEKVFTIKLSKHHNSRYVTIIFGDLYSTNTWQFFNDDKIPQILKDDVIENWSKKEIYVEPEVFYGYDGKFKSFKNGQLQFFMSIFKQNKEILFSYINREDLEEMQEDIFSGLDNILDL